jgi:hypothetical protein
MRLDSMTSTEATPIPDVSNLPRDIDLLIPMIVQLADELTREREKRRLLQHEFDLLLKRLWGPKSEKVAAGQRALFDTVPDTGELAAIARQLRQQPRKQPSPTRAPRKPAENHPMAVDAARIT